MKPAPENLGHHGKGQPRHRLCQVCLNPFRVTRSCLYCEGCIEVMKSVAYCQHCRRRHPTLPPPKRQDQPRGYVH